MNFNTDVLLSLHRKHDLRPVLQTVQEKRVVNPRSTEPINVKSVFELITDPEKTALFQNRPWHMRLGPGASLAAAPPDRRVKSSPICWSE